MNKKNFVLRLEQEAFDALSKWAADDFRSVNGQIEWLLHENLKKAGRLKKKSDSDTNDDNKSTQKNN